MHTDHSHDCATPVEVLLATAHREGLGAIAVTDHNEISGALEAREKAARRQGDRGRGGQDRHQGEVIGLFMEEKIERGMTLAETIAEIKRQGGLVYVPHPFDRMHAVPDYEHLLDGDRRRRRDRGLQPARGVQAVQRGGGPLRRQVPDPGGRRARTRTSRRAWARCASACATSTGREEFLESLRDADIIRKPTSLLYVQALKFLETKATPAGARRARRDRRGAAPGLRRPRGGASPDAPAGRAEREPSNPHGDARDRRRDPREVPGAGDPRAERVHARAAGLPALPARQPDAGARLRATRRPTCSCSSTRPRRRRSRRAWPSTAAPAPR